MPKILFESDWLASNPFFYNEQNGSMSHNINDVIDLKNVQFHPEGFNNYLDFGYSILEQTPIQNVKFLRYSSRVLSADNKVYVQYLDDPVEKFLDYKLSEYDIIECIREKVNKWESSVQDEIIIPTSGGYDSRLLNWCIKDKSRVRSFSYGLSTNQFDSYEALYAQKLSEILGTRWEQIILGDFHNYFYEWYDLFGVSTHAHGMYHIEFYKKIMEKVKGNNAFLSGIGGDWWAGNVIEKNVNDSASLKNLGYTHGLNADSHHSLFNKSDRNLEEFFNNYKYYLNEWKQQILIMGRLKIILISYLSRIPRNYGFNVFSPFLELDIAMAMLNLPSERKINRKWLNDFFRREGINIEDMKIKASISNTLNYQAIRLIPLEPLNVNVLTEVFHSEYVKWINKSMKNINFKLNSYFGIQFVPRYNGLLRRIGSNKNLLDAYYAYLTLKPIEILLLARNNL